jgi:uncharacterized membrane protein
MPAVLTGYLGAAAAMIILDAIWLSLAVPRIYQPAIGHLLADKPNFVIAAVFYLLYLVGVVVFAVMPGREAGSWIAAAFLGGLLGAVAYGTYDFTNLSTLRGWPLGLSLIDVAWGIVLTAIAALAGYTATTALSAG